VAGIDSYVGAVSARWPYHQLLAHRARRQAQRGAGPTCLEALCNLPGCGKLLSEAREGGMGEAATPLA
jgi:hypothetical protein